MNRSWILTLVVLLLSCIAVLYMHQAGFVATGGPDLHEPDCSGIEAAWGLRQEEASLYSMQDDVVDAIASGDIEAAVCTLKVALRRARAYENDLLVYKLTTQLAELYEEHGVEEAAIVTLEAAVADFGQDTETQRITRIDLLLRLVGISDAINDRMLRESYLEEAIVESSDLEYGALTRDRVLLAAVEHFKAIGNYERAANYAKELVELRRQWNEQLSGHGDPEHVRAAQDLYQQMEALRIKAMKDR